MEQPKIIVETHALARLPALCGLKSPTQVSIITDTHLEPRAQEMRRAMLKKRLVCNIITLAAGEASKRMATVEQLCVKLAKSGLKRDGCIIGLAGGVVGDIAGFVAWRHRGFG